MTDGWFYDAIACFRVASPNIMQFAYDTFISIIIIAIGTIFFFKFNMRSQWMNPDHPSDKEKD